MTTYRCLGSIKNVQSIDLYNEIVNIIPHIKGRPRILGYDIECENETFSFYINTYDEKESKIDISILEDKKLLFHLLDSLKKVLIKLQTEFDLVYFIENEKGEQISDDYIYIDTFKV